MKKKIALLLAAAMTIASVPANVFASSMNDLSKASQIVPKKTLFIERNWYQTGNQLTSRVSDNNGNLAIEYVIDGTDLRLIIDQRVTSRDSLTLRLDNAKWAFRASDFGPAGFNTMTDNYDLNGKDGNGTLRNVMGRNTTFSTTEGTYVNWLNTSTIPNGYPGAGLVTGGTPIAVANRARYYTRNPYYVQTINEAGNVNMYNQVVSPNHYGSSSPGTGWTANQSANGLYSMTVNGTTRSYREIPYRMRFNANNDIEATLTFDQFTDMGRRDGNPTGNVIDYFDPSVQADFTGVGYDGTVSGDPLVYGRTTTDGTEAAGLVIIIPLVAVTTAETATVNVLNSNISGITSAPYAFAQSTSGNGTVASVQNPQTARTDFSIEKLEIHENNFNSMVGGTRKYENGAWVYPYRDNSASNVTGRPYGNYVEIKAPSGFEFTSTQSGNKYNNSTGILNGVEVFAEPGLEFATMVGTQAIPDMTFQRVMYKDLNPTGSERNWDYSTIVVDLVDLQRSTTTKGYVWIRGLKLIAEEHAPWGDIMLNIRNFGAGVTEQSFKAGTRQDWTIRYEAVGDIPTLYNGAYNRFSTNRNYGVSGATVNGDLSINSEDSYHKTAKVLFQEYSVAAWWADRQTIFELPEQVKFRKVEFATFDNIFQEEYDQGVKKDKKVLELYGAYGTKYYRNQPQKQGYVYVDGNKITIDNLKIKSNEKAKMEMNLWVSIESGFEGDVTLKAHGSAIPTENALEPIVIAKARSPITVEPKYITDIKIGYQYQPVADFTITEDKAGILEKNKRVNVSLSDEISTDMGFTVGINHAIEGNLKIKDLTVTNTRASAADTSLNSSISSGGTISFVIATPSTVKPASITFSNVQIKIDRTVPETNKEPYNLIVWGTAVAPNFNSQIDAPYDAFPVAGIKAPYLKVVTSATDKDSILNNVVKVTIGDPVISVGSTTATMDVAAFIDESSNTTMVPVRFISVALGIPDDQVQWDPDERTVTIYNGARVVQFKIGSDQLVVNGISSAMKSVDGLPVKAMIVDDRSFIPFRHLGTALGVEVSWDNETRTAIYNSQLLETSVE